MSEHGNPVAVLAKALPAKDLRSMEFAWTLMLQTAQIGVDNELWNSGPG